jgi:hypothetical protein
MVVGVNVSISTINPSSSGKSKVAQICFDKSIKNKRGFGWECNFFSCLGSGKSKAAQNCFDKSIKNKRGFGMRVQLFFTFR